MQLERGERRAAEDLVEERVVGFDEHAHGLHPARDAGHERRRAVDGDVAGRGGVEHEADPARAAGEGAGEGVGSAETADLDGDRAHSAPDISSAMRRAASAGSSARVMGLPITR